MQNVNTKDLALKVSIRNVKNSEAEAYIIGFMKCLCCKKSRLISIVQVLSMVAIVVIAVAATYKRTAVWQNEITLWGDVIEKSPGKARGYISIGLAYYRREEYIRAMKNYNRALQLDPSDQWLHYNLGLFFLNPAFRDLERSRQEFEQVLSQNPDDTRAWKFLSFVLRLQQDSRTQ